jgi:hypothetical protein
MSSSKSYEDAFVYHPVYPGDEMFDEINTSDQNIVISYIQECNFSIGIIWRSVRSLILIRVPGHRSRGRGFDSRRYQVLLEVFSLERNPLNFVWIIEEVLE